MRSEAKNPAISFSFIRYIQQLRSMHFSLYKRSFRWIIYYDSDLLKCIKRIVPTIRSLKIYVPPVRNLTKRSYKFLSLIIFSISRSLTSIPAAEAFKKSRRLFRLQDIGIFNLCFSNFIDLGVIIDRIYFIYTNVNNFAEHLQTFNKSQTSL